MCHSLHPKAQPWHTKTQVSGHRKDHTCMKVPQALKQAYSQGYPESAMHVQESIGSRNSAIHNDYHTSLRPSSVLEPRYPSLKVVTQNMYQNKKLKLVRSTKLSQSRHNGNRNNLGRRATPHRENATRVARLPCHPRASAWRKCNAHRMSAAAAISTQSLTWEVHIDWFG